MTAETGQSADYAESAGIAEQSSAGNAAESAGTGGALTAAEQAYFASRGASGLPQPLPWEEGQAAPQPAQAQRAPAPMQAAETAETARQRQAKAQQWLRDLGQQDSPQGGAAARGQNLQAAQNLQNPQNLPPDPREDFLGFARWQGQEIVRLNEALAGQRQQAEERQRAEAADAAIMREWEASVSGLRSAHAPDIDDALEFLQEMRMGQLSALAPLDSRFGDSAFCGRQMAAELRDIVVRTFQQGKNPAAAVYDLARAYGYGRDETERLNTLRQAMPRARSIAAGSGAQAGEPFLLETVANLPEAEFAKWYEHNKQSFRAMFGG